MLGFIVHKTNVTNSTLLSMTYAQLSATSSESRLQSATRFRGKTGRRWDNIQMKYNTRLYVLYYINKPTKIDLRRNQYILNAQCK